VNALKDEVNIKSKQTIVDLKQSQIHLSQRLLAILRTYICKITQANNQNNASLHRLGNQEVKLKNVLAQMNEESKQLVHLYGRVNKMCANLGLNSRENQNGYANGELHRENGMAMGRQFMTSNGMQQQMEHVNPNNMKQMFSFLKQQQQFIQLLAKTVQNDMKDLNVIANGNGNSMHAPSMYS